jgi:hypothetical protein
MLMGWKRTRTAPVPRHPCFASAPSGCQRLGAKDRVAEDVRFRRFHVFGDSKLRIAPIPPENVLFKGDLPGLVLGIRRNDGDLAPADVVISSGRQAEQLARLPNVDGLSRNDLKLV